MFTSMAPARAVRCEVQPPKPVPRAGAVDSGSSSPEQVKIVLQPRLCTLRSYASDRGTEFTIRTIVTKSKDGGGGGGDGGVDQEELLSPFLANLYEYIESSKKSHDFEIITGRLAMIVFAATIGVELTTGNSVFKKMDVQGIAEGLGACVAAVTCAAAFAYSSSARKRVGRIFTISCNAFIDALIDNIIDSLFYENDDEDDPSDNNNLND